MKTRESCEIRMIRMFFQGDANTAEISRRLNEPEHYVDRVIAHEMSMRWHGVGNKNEAKP